MSQKSATSFICNKFPYNGVREGMHWISKSDLEYVLVVETSNIMGDHQSSGL